MKTRTRKLPVIQKSTRKEIEVSIRSIFNTFLRATLWLILIQLFIVIPLITWDLYGIEYWYFIFFIQLYILYNIFWVKKILIPDNKQITSFRKSSLNTFNKINRIPTLTEMENNFNYFSKDIVRKKYIRYQLKKTTIVFIHLNIIVIILSILIMLLQGFSLSYCLKFNFIFSILSLFLQIFLYINTKREWSLKRLNHTYLLKMNPWYYYIHYNNIFFY